MYFIIAANIQNHHTIKNYCFIIKSYIKSETLNELRLYALQEIGFISMLLSYFSISSVLKLYEGVFFEVYPRTVFLYGCVSTFAFLLITKKTITVNYYQIVCTHSAR